ncbi:IS1096 element passenger TnpR family protein [Planktosalinus lacus]|uniref:Plasmid pRiA4b Orf3-like domain-containing protein n=1 Tax=Planktosalinus lacus TaxID=1526573 RepID=A0A8J2VAC0_9FLAO|nr:hypothetical protein [Planktosalinus lacus]GGD91313.1 hypothetical protein GCM10011312_13860 [Planktosalinus lacus]
MIYRFRVILDAHDDVFRDIEISKEATLEDFHNAITQAFGFGGQEMASFFTCDKEWNQDEEISLFSMDDADRNMQNTLLEDVVSKDNTKLIYIYDFLSMWTFMVELADIAEPVPGTLYPNLMFAHGEIPDQAPEKEFETEALFDEDEDADELDPDEYDDLNFDENWN